MLDCSQDAMMQTASLVLLPHKTYSMFVYCIYVKKKTRMEKRCFFFCFREFIAVFFSGFFPVLNRIKTCY